MPLRGARRSGAGAPVANGGWPPGVPDEAPAARRHHAPLLHQAATPPSSGVAGASASDQPHEVPRRLRSRRENAAISAPSSGEGAGVGGGEPGLCRDGGGAEEGAHAALGLGRAAEKDVCVGGLTTIDKKLVRFTLHRRVPKRSWPSAPPPEVKQEGRAGRPRSAAPREKGAQERMEHRVEAGPDSRRPRADGARRATAPGRGPRRGRKAPRDSS